MLFIAQPNLLIKTIVTIVSCMLLQKFVRHVQVILRRLYLKSKSKRFRCIIKMKQNFNADTRKNLQ